MADLFGGSTQQNILTGGDGAKLYGWKLLNSAHATTVDVNISSSGYLYIVSTGATTPAGATFNVPFVYQDISGNFDINVYMASGSPGAHAYGLVVRDPNASAGEDWLGLINVIGDQTYNRNTVNSSTSGYAGDGTVRPYLRINRTGNVFTTYVSANGSSWTQCGNQFTRNDYAASVQVGMYSADNALYDYYQGTNAGGTGTTGTIAMTVPLPTMSIYVVNINNTLAAVVPLPTMDIEVISANLIGMGLVVPLPSMDIEVKSTNDVQIALTVPLPSMDIEVKAGKVGTMALVFPLPSMTGQFASDMELIILSPTMAIEVVSGAIIDINAVAPLPSMDIEVISGNVVEIAIVSLLPSCDIEVLTGNTLDCNLTFPKSSFNGVAFAGNSGDMALIFPLPSMTGMVFQTNYLNFDMVVPLPSIDIEASNTAAITNVYCMNTKTGAVTQFDNWPFNSIDDINNVKYGASYNGIYKVLTDSASDNGTPINAYMKTGISDMGSPLLKRIAAIYAGLRGDGQYQIGVITDDNNLYTYPACTDKNNPHQVRVLPGKGLRGRYYQIECQNVDGMGFELDNLEVMFDTQERRVVA